MFRSSSFALASVLFATTSASAGLVNLGAANGYNVLVFGDNTQTGTDAEGKVAVGGNANFGNGYTVGSRATDPNAANLVIRGNYANTGNTIYGNAVVGGNANVANPSIKGGFSVNGNVNLTGGGTIDGVVTYGGTLTNAGTTLAMGSTKGTTPLPVDFASAQSQLTTLSANLAKTIGSTYGSGVTFQYGGFTLTGTSADVNVFTIKGTDLAAANGINLSAPAGSTVVVNVDGNADQMKGFGFSYSGVDRQHVLFNFSQATSLLLDGIGVQGSILAPLAAINFAGGNIDGTIIGASITGRGESHNYQFLGNLAGVPTVNGGVIPEPASLVSTAIGLALVGGGTVRARRRRLRPARA